jgi:formate-dependent nitrite reductase cytochrome c552 subunit
MEQGKENLEKKITFWDRAKYASIPAVLTVGSCFIPEIKKKYSSLPEEKKDTYKTVALAGTTLVGAIITLTSGYNLFKDYKKEKITETVVVQ